MVRGHFLSKLYSGPVGFVIFSTNSILFVPNVQGQFDGTIVCFSPCTAESGSFVANRIWLNTNASGIETDSKLDTDALIYIKFPSGDVSALTHLCVHTDRLETKQNNITYHIFFLVPVKTLPVVDGSSPTSRWVSSSTRMTSSSSQRATKESRPLSGSWQAGSMVRSKGRYRSTWRFASEEW